MPRVCLLLAASVILAAQAAPLCKDEGFWGTSWCLVVKTGSLGRDAVTYAVVNSLPLPWLAFLESLQWPALAKLQSKVATPLLAEMQRRLPTTVWTPTIPVRLTAFANAFRAATEKHRSAFVSSFPRHAAILEAGDSAGLVTVCVWLALALALVRHGSYAWQMWRRPPEVMFFPDRSGKNVARICREIGQARHRVWLAMFTFTDDLLSEAIVRACDRGVDVRVIVDDAQCDVSGGEAKWLANRGVPVTTDMSGALMHHKFVVLDNTVLSGSFNWTRAGSMANNENLCVLQDPCVVKPFAREFASLWFKFTDRGGRLNVKRAGRRCLTPRGHTHTHGGG